MPFPIQISDHAFTTFGIPGPFLFGTARYACLEGFANVVSMYKSVDGGQTWNEMDAANAPISAGDSPQATCSDGVSKMFTVSTGTLLDVFQISIFDTTTDKWLSSTPLPALQFPSGNSVAICYRPDKTLVISTQINTLGVSFAKYFTFDTIGLTGSAYTAMGINDGAEWSGHVAFRGIGRTHIILKRLSGTQRTVYQQALTDGGALGACTIVDDINDADDSFLYDNGGANATTAAICWAKQTSLFDVTTILQAPIINANTLVWSSQTVSVGAGNTVNQAGVAVGALGVYFFAAVFLPGPVPPTQILYALDTGAGFAANVILGNIDEEITNVWGEGLESGNVGLVMTGVTPVFGAFYWETAGSAPPVVPVVPLPLVPVFFPFPWGPQCCDPCSDDVACIRPMADGRIYLNAKGAVRKVGT